MGGIGDNNTINCLVWNAKHADVPPDYTPPCNGTLAVILVPCSIQLDLPYYVTNAQVTVANIPIRCSCQVGAL